MHQSKLQHVALLLSILTSLQSVAVERRRFTSLSERGQQPSPSPSSEGNGLGPADVYLPGTPDPQRKIRSL